MITNRMSLVSVGRDLEDGGGAVGIRSSEEGGAEGRSRIRTQELSQRLLGLVQRVFPEEPFEVVATGISRPRFPSAPGSPIPPDVLPAEQI